MCSKYITENGVLILPNPDLKYSLKGYNNLIKDEKRFSSFGSDGLKLQPSSLKGIENNNGCIKIESEEDLPKEKGFYQCVKDNGMVLGLYFSADKEWRCGEQDQTKQVTHWSNLNNPPIY